MDHGDGANRNLLFGLLALQNGRIDQAQLVAAFQSSTRDKARPLADHLSARGGLDADGRAAVEAMVALHDYRFRLTVSFNMAGDLARQLGRIDALGDFAVKARDLMEAIHRADPKSTTYTENLSKAFNNLGRFQAAKDRRAEALASFRRSIELRMAKPADDPEGVYNLACYLALALSVIDDADGPEREALATQAIAALRRAFAKGVTAIEIYRTDSDLDSLRNRDDFRLFLMDIVMPKRPFAR